MIFYFSGTGNSLWVARQLQESLQEPLYKLVDVLSSDQVYALGEEERLGFVFPVYSWGPPEVVLEMISRLRLSREPSFLYFVCTCGDMPERQLKSFARRWSVGAGPVRPVIPYLCRTHTSVCRGLMWMLRKWNPVSGKKPGGV